MSKFNFKNPGTTNNDASKYILGTTFYYGRVIDNNDPIQGGRIKVRILGIDDTISSVGELPYCFPMLQKFFYAIPKIGETVMILIPNINNPSTDRKYFGPIISQPQKLSGDSTLYSATSGMDSGVKEPDPAPNTDPDNFGVYPKINDIAIQGRNNSDIVLKKEEVLIRSGYYDFNTNKGEIPKFNSENPAYIKIKPYSDSSTSQKKTSINIVADNINILSHKSRDKYNLTDATDYIPDIEIEEIVKSAHPVVFGDNLIEYLKLQRLAFLSHVHPYPGLKPQDLAGSSDIDNYINYNLDDLNSKNIKIN